MKILEIVLSLSNGGAERFVVDISNEMSKLEDVTLLVLKDFQIGNNGFYKKEVSDRVRLINLGFQDGFKFSYLIKIMKTVRFLDPDVIHIHDVADKYCLLPMIFHSSHKIVVQTIHNDIKSLYKDLYHKFTLGFLGGIGHLSFVTISDRNSQDFSRVYPRARNKMIYNGRARMIASEKINEVRRQISSWKKNDSTLVLLHIARCAPQKNQSLLVSCFCKWIKSGANAILLICGSGYDSDLGKKLKSISESSVHFIGPQSNVTDYLLCSDAFVLSSLFEGMPITVIEAISLGVPVLSTPVCGVVDTIKDCKNGCISSDFTEESYLEMLMKYSTLSTTLKLNCSKRDTNLFSIESCAFSYIEYFNSLKR